MTWQLGIDFGTSYTTAAITDDGRGLRMLELSTSGNKVPSCVLQRDGEFIIGDTAQRQAALFPDAFEPTPKRRFRRDSVVQLGDRQLPPSAMVTAVLEHVMSTATREQPANELSHVVLTHPALWGPEITEQLETALRETGLCGNAEVEVYPEPVAAADYYVHSGAVSGSLAAVFDLGGGTFDTAVLRQRESAFELFGAPGGDENLGGEDFDDQLFHYVISVLHHDDPDTATQLAGSTEPTWAEARRQLRQSVKSSKEALSFGAQDHFHIGLPVNRDFQLTRDELMSCISDEVDASVENFAATVHRAQDDAGRRIDKVFLVGGSSRIPAIYAAVRNEFGDVIETRDNPKNVVALGAALHASKLAAEHHNGPPPPPPPPPPKPPPKPKPKPDPQPKKEPKTESERKPDPTPDLPLASRGTRLGAYLVDGLLTIVTLYIGWLIWSIAVTWPKGQSPAKGMFSMYVIDVKTGRPATTGKMAARFLVDLAFSVVGIFTLFIPVLVNSLTIFGKKQQRLTDMIVGTRVVHDPTGQLG